MADEEVYYSAKHWAKKSEKFANETKDAKESAETAIALVEGFDTTVEQAKTAITSLATEEKNNIRTVGDEEEAAVTSAGTTGVANVKAAETTGVANVNKATSDGVAQIQAEATGFVNTSSNQTVGGQKTFTTSPKIVNPSGQNTQLLLSDATANSEIGVMQATSNGKNQFLIRFGNGNKYPFVISQDVSDSSKFTYQLISSPAASDNSTLVATTAWVNTRLGGTGVTSTELGYLDGVTSNVQTQLNAKAPLASPALTGAPTAPTPAVADNSTKIATTAWVTSNSTKNSFKPNWAGKVSVSPNTNYTAPSNGSLAYKCSVWNRTPKLTINSVDIFSYGGNVIAGFFGSVPVCKGDVINLSGDGEAVIYFVPFK